MTRTAERSFVTLISGGFDSPVAAFLVAKLDFTPIFLHFTHQDPALDPPTIKKVVENAQRVVLTTKAREGDVVIVNNAAFLEHVVQSCARKLTCLLCKRMMIRVAREVAMARGSDLIVTGDILGEQASQTLYNLQNYRDVCADIALFRPLVGFDKLRVMTLAREIGTHDISVLAEPACPYVPRYPETRGKRQKVLSEERKLDVRHWLEALMSTQKVIKVRATT